MAVGAGRDVQYVRQIHTASFWGETREAGGREVDWSVAVAWERQGRESLERGIGDVVFVVVVGMELMLSQLRIRLL